MATAALKNYLLSLIQDTQGTEIEVCAGNLLLPYSSYLETVHYDSTEYQSSINQLTYCFAGKCEVEINNKTLCLTTGNILLTEEDTDHIVRAGDKNAIIVKSKLENNSSWQKQVE